MLKDQILKASDLKVAPVEVSEWGLTVYVRKMTVGEVNSVVKQAHELQKNGDESDLFALIACKTLADETGKRLFTDLEVESLKSKSFEAIKRVAEAAAEFNNLNQKAVEDQKKT